jgi:hypothetical protein
MAQNQSASGQSSAEELSSRVRSGSFSRTGPGNVRPTGTGDASKISQDETRIMFHRELMETCADLMSRYTYGNSAPYAQQSDTVGKILKVRFRYVAKDELSNSFSYPFYRMAPVKHG